MDVKFDMVRIGVKRENHFTEQIIKENVTLLQKSIRDLLTNEECSHKDNTEHITMIVPAKGKNIAIMLQDVKDKHIKKILKDGFPDSIYKGSLDNVLDNMSNKVFR